MTFTGLTELLTQMYWVTKASTVSINYFDAASQMWAFRMLKPENFNFWHGIRFTHMHRIQLFGTDSFSLLVSLCQSCEELI